MGVAASQSYQPQSSLLKNVPPYLYNYNPSSQKDTVQLSNKTVSKGVKKLSTTQKLLFGLDALTSAAALGIVAVRQRKASALKETQKVFQDVFMRNDITLTETKQMLQNYKNISKIMIHSKIDSNKVLNAVHHEFRHAKQNYLAFHYNPEEYIVAMNHGISTYTNISNYEGLSVKEGIQWLSEYMGKPNRANVSKECEKFAINCLKTKHQTFNPERNHEAYRNSYREKDAYKAGDSIERVLKKFI